MESIGAERRASILIVDDTLENLRLLSTMLRGQGYEVRPVTSGKQALAAVEHDLPALILLDISMPEMSGYEVCERLKAEPRSRDIPVIFLTAMTELDSRVNAFKVGGIDYITKPFHLDEVYARVRAHLNLRNLQAQLEERNRHLQESYTRLRELEKLRDDLIHMVVHDMRSPLSRSLVLLELAAAELPPNVSEETRTMLGEAHAATRELVEMAQQLLDINRMEHRALQLNLEAHTAREIANKAVADSQSMAHQFGVVLENRARDVRMRCDEMLVRRILLNLLSNGIKHAPRDTSVVVSAELDAQGGTLISVSDRGPGIPAEYRQRIFEKFEQLGARRSKQYHSVGLGLAFCKLATEAHGGAIGVECLEGQGSRFWFTLPAAS